MSGLLFTGLLLAMGAAPSPTDIAALEQKRLLAPFTDATKTARQYSAEFAPTVETRNVDCVPKGEDGFSCRFESRTKGFFDADFGAWIARSETVQRSTEGHWRFQAL
jgi:hypothetical protein